MVILMSAPIRLFAAPPPVRFVLSVLR